MPARPYKPRDKAKVENAVLLVERWILAALRHQKFFSLAELNEAIATLLERLNQPAVPQTGRHARLAVCRTGPAGAASRCRLQRYVIADWKTVRASIDYHVEVDRHYYSVPYQLAGQQTGSALHRHHGRDLSCAANASPRICAVPRLIATPPFKEHMPKSHQAHLEWTPSRLIHWAETVGAATAQVVRTMLESKPHPGDGLPRLSGNHAVWRRPTPMPRLEAASQRAARNCRPAPIKA